MLGRTWYFYILEYWRLFHIILIHPLNKAFHQMMKISRPVFSLFHGYISVSYTHLTLPTILRV